MPLSQAKGVSQQMFVDPTLSCYEVPELKASRFKTNSDCVDFFTSLSGKFFNHFSAADWPCELYFRDWQLIKSEASKFCKNEVMRNASISLIDEAVELSKQGLCQMPSYLTDKAIVYWKFEKPRQKLEIFSRQRKLGNISSILIAVMDLEFDFVGGFWDSKYWPQEVRRSLLESTDAVLSDADYPDLIRQMRDCIDEGFDLLCEGDEVRAQVKIHYAARIAASIDQNDPSCLLRTPKPWDTEVLPDEPWIVGV